MSNHSPESDDALGARLRTELRRYSAPAYLRGSTVAWPAPARGTAGADRKPVATGPHERRRVLGLGVAPGRPGLLHRVRHGLRIGRRALQGLLRPPARRDRARPGELDARRNRRARVRAPALPAQSNRVRITEPIRWGPRRERQSLPPRPPSEAAPLGAELERLDVDARRAL